MLRILIFTLCYQSLILAEDITHSEILRFAQIVNQAKKFAANPKSDEEIINGAVNGALSSFDAHSSYMTAKEYNKTEEYINGEFAGIGIYINDDDGIIKVIGVIENSPADRAGIKIGDYITHINDKSTFKMPLEVAIKNIRGKPKSIAILIIARSAELKPRTIKITREIIKTEPVKAHYNDDILTLKISMFNAITDALLHEKLEYFLKYNNVKGIIIDLRNNPGGVLDGTIASAGFFVHQGALIVSSHGYISNTKPGIACIMKHPCRSIRYAIPKDKVDFFNASEPIVPISIPIVMVVNNATASAAEILAAAIHENARGIIIGEQTFGKGSVQTIMPIDSGKGGAMKITTALYYTPSGKSIQALGLQPDIIVHQMDIKKRNEIKPFLPDRENRMENHIKNTFMQEQIAKESNSANENDYQISIATSIIKALIINGK